MLKARNIKRKYGKLEVLKGVDLEVLDGELVSIVGASGAGKSTLLHILGTLDKADEGQFLIDDRDLSVLSDRQLALFRNQHIGFVFQFHHLLPEFSALENIAIPGWIAGRPRKEVLKDAMQLMEDLDLSNKQNSFPSELSGGEQQRVAVARSLINKPSIVMADEPTGNLDSNHASELYHLFLDLKHRFDQTFLIVTHNEQLAKLSDRVLRMKDGLLENS